MGLASISRAHLLGLLIKSMIEVTSIVFIPFKKSIATSYRQERECDTSADDTHTAQFI